MDNGRTLGFKNDNVVKYADVVLERESMTTVVRIFGGRQSMIEMPMLIFTNASNTYPIHGLENDIPDVTYKTRRQGWMDQRLFREYFLKPRNIPTRCT